MYFSIIIPVYNRPDELNELLESLVNQTLKNFEVIVVEDGSTNASDHVVLNYQTALTIQYFVKTNSGPGQSRNYGAQRANGDYFIFFDSDCIIPTNYFSLVTDYFKNNYLDAFGGPDAAHYSFTDIQKAISYTMTSIFTTGGIRGGSEKMGKFHPRSFNMGFSRKVFEVTNGFSTMRFGEDVDMSLRIIAANFSTGLIKNAFVYHKRRTDFKKFFKQVFNSGIARINLYKRHPQSLKVVHLMPSAFLIFHILLFVLLVPLTIFFNKVVLTAVSIAFPLIFTLLIFLHSLQSNSLKVSILSVYAAYVQLFSYGAGFLTGIYYRLLLKKEEFNAFGKNFYK